MIFLLISAFAALMAFDLPKLVRAKKKRDLAAYFAFLSLGFFLCLMQLLKIDIPNPARDVHYAIKDLLPFGYD